MSGSGEGTTLSVRRSPALTGTLPAFGPALPGTGFETLPPLAISTGLFKFLRCLGLESVGLGLDSVPFHAGWLLVEWRPSMSAFDIIEAEFERICVEIGKKNNLCHMLL